MALLIHLLWQSRISPPFFPTPLTISKCAVALNAQNVISQHVRKQRGNQGVRRGRKISCVDSNKELIAIAPFELELVEFAFIPSWF